MSSGNETEQLGISSPRDRGGNLISRTLNLKLETSTISVSFELAVYSRCRAGQHGIAWTSQVWLVRAFLPAVRRDFIHLA